MHRLLDYLSHVSQKDTHKEVVLGTICYGTLGCVLFFGIFGNYAVYLQISEQFNVISYLNNHGTEATIIEVMHQLPFSTITILFLISAFLFLATTFDSGSYILAAASQKSDRRTVTC